MMNYKDDVLQPAILAVRTSLNKTGQTRPMTALVLLAAYEYAPKELFMLSNMLKEAEQGLEHARENNGFAMYSNKTLFELITTGIKFKLMYDLEAAFNECK